MKNLVLAGFLLLSLSASSQYYYNDILDARAIGQRMKDYAASRVRSISATGYDAQGSRSPDFNEWQEIGPNNDQLKITTRNGQQFTRQYFRFDSQYRLTGITDSSGTIRSTTSYTYDSNDRLVLIRTVVKDSLNDFSETEEHQWSYNSTGKPQRMWRIVNGNDSSEYRFTTDDKGNVADETLYRRETGLDAVYYYYNDDNHLTDIVRYDKKVKKLLPDFMFEYDENGRIAQKTTTLSTTTRNYLIWRYLYNDKGLKVREALFNKQKELTGKIDYAYTIAP